VEVLRLFRDNNIGFVVVSRLPRECLACVCGRWAYFGRPPARPTR
jgi:hypothetical protein